MPASRQDLNRQRTIQDIKDAFLALYQEGGIGGVSISGLCQRCGVSRSTFYLYFEDKYAVLQGVEAALLADMGDICKDLADLPAGSARGVSTRLLSHIRANQGWYRALLGDKGDPSFVLRWRRDIVRSLERKLVRRNTTPRENAIMGTIFSHALIGLFSYIITEDPDAPDAVLCFYLDRLLEQFLT